jgi:hypothetical protein
VTDWFDDLGPVRGRNVRQQELDNACARGVHGVRVVCAWCARARGVRVRVRACVGGGGMKRVGSEVRHVINNGAVRGNDVSDGDCPPPA